MRASSIRRLVFVGAIALSAIRPGALHAQATRPRILTVTLTAVVPSIVKYVVDETTRTPDGSPTIRLITNDPRIRAAFARGVVPELAPARLASATPETSGHAKGDERLEAAPNGARILRYTVTAP